MENRKELMNAFLANEEGERVIGGFWHHFVSFHNHYGWEDSSIMRTVVAEQKKYIDEAKPDFIKIMSDGFFGHPSLCQSTITTLDQLKEVQSVGENHPWIQAQVDYVKEICAHAGKDVYKYYNIFSPLQYIRLRFEEYDEDFTKFTRLFKEDPKAMIMVAKRIAEDTKALVKRLFTETDVDGIYYSVQCVQDKSFTEEVHKERVQPLDLEVLNEILQYTDNVLLHICGYGKYTNHLEWYKDYPVKAFNWAIYSENISLAEGKKILNNKPVFGGFDNAEGSLLYTGTREEIKKEIYRILDESGTKGVGLGADCTIREDIDLERLQWIKDISAEYAKEKK